MQIGFLNFDNSQDIRQKVRKWDMGYNGMELIVSTVGKDDFNQYCYWLVGDIIF